MPIGPEQYGMEGPMIIYTFVFPGALSRDYAT